MVIEPPHFEGGNAADINHVSGAPDDDTLSVGPDMPDLPLDVGPDSVTSAPPASTDEISTSKEVQPAAENEEVEGSPGVEHGTLEEESTVREQPPLTEPQVEPEEGASAPQREESGGVEEKEEEKEISQQEEGVEEQREVAAPHAEEVAVEEMEVREETQPKLDSDNPIAVTADDGATTAEAPIVENTTSEEAPTEPAEGATEEVTEGGDRSCTSCTCQSLFSNYNSHAPSRRKNRPCSLPVSELETVIASACGEPETPRSHYIRIHHLLHSLPSAQHRPPSQEEEEAGEGENTSTTSTSVTLKTSKDREEEGQKDEEEEDTTQSPSQVGPLMAHVETISHGHSELCKP